MSNRLPRRSALQINARQFHPALYWAVIIATTTAGTTLADFADRSLGIGYAGGSILLLACLGLTFGTWYFALGTVSVQSIASRKAEAFYWATIMFSQTLGTALGDWVADAGLGYSGAALVFGALLAVTALLRFTTQFSRTSLFWAAFILTRPLGATVGDFLDKPIADGGLALSRYVASTILLAVIVILVEIFLQKAGRSSA